MSEGLAHQNFSLISHLIQCMYFTFQVLLNAENKAEINALATAMDKSGIATIKYRVSIAKFSIHH